MLYLGKGVGRGGTVQVFNHAVVQVCDQLFLRVTPAIVLILLYYLLHRIQSVSSAEFASFSGQTDLIFWLGQNKNDRDARSKIPSDSGVGSLRLRFEPNHRTMNGIVHFMIFRKEILRYEGGGMTKSKCVKMLTSPVLTGRIV